MSGLKGLSEISLNEFKQFIGKEMRLSQVEYAPKVDSQQILSFYMGKNTPERKDYIMENLIVTMEQSRRTIAFTNEPIHRT